MIPYDKQLIILEQMRDMFESNIPVKQILESIAEVPGVEEYVFDILEEFNTGVQLHRAIANAEIFSEEINRIIEAAHESGNMVQGLNKALELVSMEVNFRKAFRSVLIYPAVVFSIAHLAFYFVLLFLVPRFEKGILKYIDSSFLLDAYVWASHHLSVVAVVNAAVIGVIVVGIKKGWLFSLMLRLPGISRVLKQRERTVFFNVLSTLYSANLPIKDILVTATSRSKLFSRYLDVAEEVQHAGVLTFFQELCDDGAIDGTHLVAVKTALSSNTLRETFERIARRESENFKQMQNNLTEIIRPFIQVLILLGVLLPIAPLPVTILSSAIDSVMKGGIGR
jgi:type II secretory pathway component PulF